MNIRAASENDGFAAEGGEVLRASDMGFWMDKPMRLNPRGTCFQLGRDIQEVEADFFTLLPTLRELIIQNPQCRIIMTERTAELFTGNRVLMRGPFDGTAEQLAVDYSLPFLHADMDLGGWGDIGSRSGSNKVSLCFLQTGRAFIRISNFCTGSSADWSGGGVLNFELPEDFFLTMDAETLAEKYARECQKEILEDGRLAAFLEKARAKGGYLIDPAVKKSAENNHSPHSLLNGVHGT